MDRIDRSRRLVGPLSGEQRNRRLEMADKCPLHRTLATGSRLRTALDPA
jgi:uncharacterized OsmC-like protein